MKRSPFIGTGLVLLVSLSLWATPAARDGEEDNGKFDKYNLSTRLGVWSVAPSPDGKQAVLAIGDMTLRVWDIEKGQELKQWEAHKHPAIHRVLFGPDAKHIFSCSEDGTVRQWETATGKEVREFPGHIVAVKSIDVSPSGKYLLSAGSDAQLRLFEVEGGKLEHAMRIFDGQVESPFHCVAFSPQGDQALAGNAKGYVSQWDLKTGKQTAQFAGNKGAVLAVAYLPDGKSFVSADSGSIRLWDIATGKVTQALQGHNGDVSSLAVSTDGTRLVSGGADKTVRVWDLKTGKELRRHNEHTKLVTRVSFAGKGQVVSSGEDGTLVVWRLPK